jgi:hypothetical protein
MFSLLRFLYAVSDNSSLVGLTETLDVTNGLRVTGGSLLPMKKKTSIYIEPEVDVALARRAIAEGTTKAEVIRQALREAAGPALRVKPRARGVFRGPRDLASRADEHLAQSGFGES